MRGFGATPAEVVNSTAKPTGKLFPAWMKDLIKDPLTVVHRVGRITPGENIVLVLAASQHRQAAFQAAEFLMDYLKANAPFWKREEGQKGASWIEARGHDDDAAARWTKS